MNTNTPYNTLGGRTMLEAHLLDHSDLVVDDEPAIASACDLIVDAPCDIDAATLTLA